MNMTRGVIWLARSGYAARGVVYAIVAFIAVLAALGAARSVDTKGAIQQLLAQPFGAGLLWLIVIGLLAHVAWRFTQGIRDTDRHGSDAKGLLIRGGLLGSGGVNLLLALFTLSLISGLDTLASGNSSGGGKADLLQRLLGLQHSKWLIYVVALVPLGAGIAHLIKAWRAHFERYFQCDSQTMRLVRPISRIGLAARGCVFLIIAALLFMGGSRYQPTDPPGLKEAFEALQRLPAGSWLLLAIGIGLLAFALYSFAEARWRRIDLSEVMD
ncbi:DUF1206 domain-containing protein [Stutzerimonas stutzeri]|uniref:DUF1206 domain-containing protein n=1 Tax=Stutzerimonas sp. S1 TaxID=3030652 RepID=UPI0022244682|nr:DUF1206 domain-containing protein [Stutzerimonas sp. S1]MCW3150037.1 DUF1206 domain-containing protein [Stutzerimonas sp. S1]